MWMSTRVDIVWFTWPANRELRNEQSPLHPCIKFETNSTFYLCNFYSSFHTINKLLLRKEQKSGQASQVQVLR